MVSVEDVNVVHLESFKRLINAFMKMLSIEELCGINVGVRCGFDLGRNNNVLARNLEILQNFAKLDFAPPRIIALGSIKKVDSIL